MDSGGYKERTFNPKEKCVNGATHGLYFIFFMLEHPLTVIPSLCTPVALGISLAINDLKFDPINFVTCLIAVPVVAVFLFASTLYILSRMESTSEQSPKYKWEDYLDIKNEKLKRAYAGKRIPMETMFEAYMNGDIDFKIDPLKVLWLRNDLFRMCFTPGHYKFFLSKFVGQLVHHSQKADTAEVRDVYDRGNDFYRWFLGPRMVYTSGIFENQDESLEDAQDRKLDLVCRQTKMKPGQKHLDIGCGWSTLICHAAKNFGTKSIGVTLAREQKKWMQEEFAPKYGVEKKVDVLCMDYRDIPKQQFDVITCLEMAEHVGIKNFQTFLLQVKEMLTDEGFFYLQIAGLRRAWQFEDLIWGLFMGTYIFPAADASCPLGFVVTQCERAGYEVHRVENCGVHYALTINHWYNNWVENKDKVINKYGQWWYRLWIIFLAWSTIIASQGSSTVFLITLHKNFSKFERRDHFIGPYPIATQQ